MQSSDSAYNAGYMLGKVLGFGIGLGLMVAMIVCLVMAIRRKSTGWIVAAAVSGLLVLGGIGVAVLAAVTGVVSAAAKMDKLDQRLTTENQKYALTVPHSWRSMKELNAKAVIASGNGAKEQYFILITEPKQGFAGALADYSIAATGRMAERAQNGKLGDFEHVSLNGRDALQRRLTGNFQGMEIAYLHTSIETDGEWCQLICWTLAPREKIAFPVFEKVVKTFEVK